MALTRRGGNASPKAAEFCRAPTARSFRDRSGAREYHSITVSGGQSKGRVVMLITAVSKRIGDTRGTSTRGRHWQLRARRTALRYARALPGDPLRIARRWNAERLRHFAELHPELVYSTGAAAPEEASPPKYCGDTTLGERLHPKQLPRCDRARDRPFFDREHDHADSARTSLAPLKRQLPLPLLRSSPPGAERQDLQRPASAALNRADSRPQASLLAPVRDPDRGSSSRSCSSCRSS